ncbi:MAG: phytanoyl-CoA dioxygenase family protein [Chitinophagales bacterium]
MLQMLRDFIRKKDTVEEVVPDIDFFLDDKNKQFFKENGYVVIKGVVTDTAIGYILEAYKQLSSYEGFYESDGFITSANYGIAIQQEIHKTLSKVSVDVLPKIFDIRKIHYNLLNVLVLKFCKDKKEFFPHQDVPLVEESKGNTIFAWIPTTDIDDQNGSLLVLPGSHKHFRWQRTHDQGNSPLKNIHDEILKHMIPVFLSKGDLILFDNSLIHASAPNRTNEVRIAMNTGIAPKNLPLINYKLIDKDKNNIEKYFIDEQFWHDGLYIDPHYVPERYHPAIKERIRRTKYFSVDEFRRIIKK